MTTMSPIRGGILHLSTPQEGRYSQSLERGLAILRAFTPERHWMGIAEIAEHLEMSRPTTHRYASTLVALNYLEQGRGRKYRLGMRAADPGRSAVASTAVRRVSPELLAQLRDSSGCTASLAVLDVDHIVYVDRARSVRQGRSEVNARLGRGSRLPAVSTALGQALLAELPEPGRRQALGGEGEQTQEESAKLMDELDRVRRRGIAVANQLHVPGQVCVAAAVRCRSGDAVAAVDVAAATTDFSVSEAGEHFGPLVRDCAEQMSAELGYTAS
jgi:IclR family transcriptional regulator, pca regulon regulatory protein